MFYLDPGLYVSSGLKKKKMELCEALMKGRPGAGLYIIYKNENSGKPEFTRGIFLRQSYYSKRRVHVLGLAEDYDEALEYLAYSAAEAAGVF
ncbi:MAG: hypothetical protein IKI75_04615 [Lachnospiraceae bacterium]|nr:hypothetical protein [Lachnospiraceae bacterium]